MTIEKDRVFSSNLIDLADKILSYIPIYDSPQAIAHMCTSFLAKQRHHFKSLLKLEGDRDSWLIARSMLEGYFRLEYAYLNKPEEVCARWGAFGIIDDFRSISSIEKDQGTYDQAEKDHLISLLSGFSGVFLTPSERSNLERGRPLSSDPYVKDWLPLTAKEYLSQDEDDHFYRTYQVYSQWHHWNCSILTHALKSNTNETSNYSYGNEKEFEDAMSTGIMCLIETAHIANHYFELGLESEIMDIRDQYLGDFV